MAQLTALIVSHDEEFKRQAAQMMRACGVPVGIVDGRGNADGSSPGRRGRRPSCRRVVGHGGDRAAARRSPSDVDLRRREAAESDLILGAMRAGANEFFPWLPGGQTQASRSMEESFHGAMRKTAARREAAQAGSRQPCVTHVFLGAKGGAGTTTVSVNCAVELARLTRAGRRSSSI